jgi:hypothetical protein
MTDATGVVSCPVQALLPTVGAAPVAVPGTAATADAAAQAAWMNQLRAQVSEAAAGAAGGPRGAGGRRAAAPSLVQDAALKVKGAVLSPVGVAVLVFLAVFVLTMVLLAAIQPPFVMQPPASKLEAETLSGKRVAVGGLVAACVAGVCIAIAALVIHSKRKARLAAADAVPTAFR